MSLMPTLVGDNHECVLREIQAGLWRLERPRPLTRLFAVPSRFVSRRLRFTFAPSCLSHTKRDEENQAAPRANEHLRDEARLREARLRSNLRCFVF